MKYLVFLLSSAINFQSQNLVPNASFETYTLCPISMGKIESAILWNAAASSRSTDYFNSCSTGSYGVPYNSGFQFARTGNAYAGLMFYYTGGSREYLQVQLISPLIQNTTYYVEFYANLNNSYWSSECNNIAANLSISRPYSPVGALLPLSPHIMITGNPIISDTLNWVKISGCYTAQGGEEYLTIGNFFDDTNTQGGVSNISYYYIDDVWLEEMSGSCANRVNELHNTYHFELLPNPTNGVFNVFVGSQSDEQITYKATNSLGQLVETKTIESNRNHQIDLTGNSAGVYFVTIQGANGIKTEKIILQK